MSRLQIDKTRSDDKAIDYRFRILYAIAIIQVVLNHCQGGGLTVLPGWIPGHCCVNLFLFSSGYFYRAEAEENVGKTLLKKVRRLLLPLYLYNVGYGLLGQFLHKAGFSFGGSLTLYTILVAPLNNGHQFDLNLGGWFIAPLFMVEMANCMFRKLVHRINSQTPEAVFFILSIMLGAIGIHMGWQYNGEWRLALIRMLYCMPFYCLGIFYRQVLEKKTRALPSIGIFGGFFALKLMMALFFGRLPVYTPSWCNDFTEGPFMPIIEGFADIVFFLRLARILEPALSNSRGINLLARNTYSIMINHLAGMLLVKAVLAFLSLRFSCFDGFDWNLYREDVFWCYQINGVWPSLILYPIAGIAFPLLVQKSLDRIKSFAKRKELCVSDIGNVL